MKIKILWGFIGAVIGVGLGFFLWGSSSPRAIDGSHPVRENREYQFISPLLYYQVPETASAYTSLESKIQDLVRSKGPDTMASVYFRDLNTGHWFGINEEQKYTPASLLKVVVMIAYFKEAEIQPAALSRPIVFSRQIQSLIGAIPYDEGTELQLGKTYLASDLIERMIINSDNGATYALLAHLDGQVLDHVFQDLGLQNPQELGREYTIAAKDYVSFFRILYNATYLNRTMSERALALLSKTAFRDGIVAGIPGTVPVSHKYGEVVIPGDLGNEAVELHDCGIVYHPNSPYLLCIMTRERSPDKAASIADITALIKDISAAIYASAGR